MLTVDASSNHQIWTASLMRWARKAPPPSDEGQAHRLAARMDIFFLHLFASVQKRLDEAEIASQWIHHFHGLPFWQIQSPWLVGNSNVWQIQSQVWMESGKYELNH